MQDLELKNNKDGVIYLECRSDNAINVCLGATDSYVEIILKDDDVTVITRWLVNYLNRNVK